MTAIAMLSACEQLAAIHAGRLSCEQVVGAAVAQIGRLDPLLHAFITVRCDEALAEARQLDRRLRQGQRLPLHGLPVAIKDVIPTAGIRTTWGSLQFADHVPDEDASLVRRLRAAGAVIVGKASTPEFGAGLNTRNALCGTTLSPWAMHRSAGGSSGGTAAAVATGMAALGVGTDLGGSVRLPAAFAGIFGLRGTPGLIAAANEKWPFDTFTVAGPMCRTAADLDLLLRVLAGQEPRSPLTPVAYHGPDRERAASLRVGWSEDCGGIFRVDAEVREVLRAARVQMEAAHVDVRDGCPQLEGSLESIAALRSLHKLIAHHDPQARSASVRDNVMIAIDRAEAVSASAVAAAELARSRAWGSVADFFERFDVLAIPTTQVAGFDATEAGPRQVDGHVVAEPLEAGVATYVVTMLGLPALSIPCGRTAVGGEPVGLQLVAARGHEAQLLGLAEHLERQLGWTSRFPPVCG